TSPPLFSYPTPSACSSTCRWACDRPGRLRAGTPTSPVPASNYRGDAEGGRANDRPGRLRAGTPTRPVPASNCWGDAEGGGASDRRGRLRAGTPTSPVPASKDRPGRPVPAVTVVRAAVEMQPGREALANARGLVDPALRAAVDGIPASLRPIA